MPLTDEDRRELTTVAETLKCTVSNGWSDYTHHQHQADALVIDFKSKRQLRAFIQVLHLYNKDRSIDSSVYYRVAAGGNQNNGNSASYSSSSCAKSEVILRLSGRRFRRFRRLDISTIRVYAGSQIGKLNKTLYERHRLILPTLSMPPHVTVGGLLANGGYGTGRDEPALSESVIAMTFMLPDGSIKRIDASHPHFDTIRGAHLGLFGILLSVDLICQPAHKLRCDISTMSPAKFIREIQNGLFTQNEAVHATYIPNYYEKERNKLELTNVCVYRFQKTDLTVKDEKIRPERAAIIAHSQLKVMNELDIAPLLRHEPSLTPRFLRHFTATATSATMTGPYFELAHLQNNATADLTTLTILFPVDSKDSTKIIRAFLIIVELLSECMLADDYPVSQSINIRYLRGSNGGLSPTQHSATEHVCVIDINTHRRMPKFFEFQKTLRDYFISHFQAKLNFGVNFPDVNYEAMYGDSYFDFLHAYAQYYRESHLEGARNPLRNLFAEQLFNPAAAPALRQRKETNHLLAPDCLVQTVGRIIHRLPAAPTHHYLILKNALQDLIGLRSYYVRTIQNTNVRFFDKVTIIEPGESSLGLSSTSSFSSTSSSNTANVYKK